MMYLLVFILAYLIGSVSGSILISKYFFGEDIRAKGSGNAGTTNALRIYGKKYAVITLFIDVIKGVIAALIGYAIDPVYSMYIAGAAVVIGHCWPIYYGFKGGKGMATSAGVNIIVNIWIILMQLALFVAVNLSMGIVSVSSILATLFALIYVLVFHNNNLPLIIMIAVNTFVVIYKHKSNIVKLINGNENKLNMIKKLFKK